jgi:hypothetical protein
MSLSLRREIANFPPSVPASCEGCSCFPFTLPHEARLLYTLGYI